MDQFALPYSTMQLWWPAGGGWGKEGSLDGGRGAKSGADRERGQGREVVRGGQGAGRVGHQLGRSHPDDHPWLSPQGHSVCRRGCWGNGAAGVCSMPPTPCPWWLLPFLSCGNWAFSWEGNLSLGLGWGRSGGRQGWAGKAKKPKEQWKREEGGQMEVGGWSVGVRGAGEGAMLRSRLKAVGHR